MNRVTPFIPTVATTITYKHPLLSTRGDNGTVQGWSVDGRLLRDKMTDEVNKGSNLNLATDVICKDTVVDQPV